MTSQSEIFNLENVEQAPHETQFYFNNGNKESVLRLQGELEQYGLDKTILCNIPPDGKNNLYYTPKNAHMNNAAKTPRWISG